MSISGTQKRRIGRPATGIGYPLKVRMQPEELAELDSWIKEQPDKPSRPEAVRRLVKKALCYG